MQDLTFRPARRADLPAMLTLLAADQLGGQREPISEEVDAAYWRAFEAIAADPRNELIVAERAGEVVGTLQLTFIPGLSRRGAERAQIEGVRVRADLRGAGIGRAMIGWAVEQARAYGCRLVQLTTDRRRTEAHRFYESLGFTASHEGFKLTL